MRISQSFAILITSRSRNLSSSRAKILNGCHIFTSSNFQKILNKMNGKLGFFAYLGVQLDLYKDAS